MKIEALVIIGVGAVAVYRVLLWLMEAARTPDPWGPEVEAEVEKEDAVPLCPHCLAPQKHNGWFCPECGSTVGQFGNYLPTVYIFSVGDAARSGIGRLRKQPLLLVGYFLVALGKLGPPLAVVYVALVARMMGRDSQEAAGPPAPVAEG